MLAGIGSWLGFGAPARSGPTQVPDEGFLSSSEVVREGHWLQVWGSLGASGVFVAGEAEIRGPRGSDRLEGQVEPAVGPAPRLLGHRLILTRDTRWRDVDPLHFVGRRVQVRGTHVPGTDRFVVDEVRSAESGPDRVEGRVERVTRRANGVEAWVLGLRVRLPSAVLHDEPLASLELAPRRSGTLSGEAPSEDDLLGEGLALSSTLRLKGQVDLRGASENNFDLDDKHDEDRLESRASGRFRVEWVPRSLWGAVVEARVNRRFRRDEGGEPSTRDDARLGEAFVFVQDALGPGVDLQVGRQDFDDAREWLYDQDLDAVRLYAAARRWRLELSVATTLADGSARDTRSTDFIVYLSNNSRRRHLAVYGIYRELAADLTKEAIHLGLRMLGSWIPANRLWLELAAYGGENDFVRRRGWGVDVGTTWEPDAWDLFSLTVGYAFGSGDADPGETDRTFRQTGFQDNTGRFAGVTSFRYYGELLDPELANLAIVTAGVGFRLARRTSLDLVYHAYRQDEATRRLVNAGIDRRLDGEHRDLGWELDLVLGQRERPSLDLELVLSTFAPGPAFRDEDPATLARAQVRYRF